MKQRVLCINSVVEGYKEIPWDSGAAEKQEQLQQDECEVLTEGHTLYIDGKEYWIEEREENA